MMRELNENMADMLTSGVTSLCHCWKLTRQPQSGAPVIYGFTDHDAPLIFDNITFEAASGFTASAIESGLGLKVDNLEVEGALSSGKLDEEAIAKGLYDDAQVEIYRVNWQDVSQRVLLRKGHLGEISRTAWGFTAELRGLAHKLTQPGGRLYQHLCDADLGDRRCGVNLASYRRSAGVFGVELHSRVILVNDTLADLDSGWLAGGKLTWTSGDNDGQSFDIRNHFKEDRIAKIELWQRVPQPVAVGDLFTVQSGCNKTFNICRTRFNNHKNFQGFPHIPSNDFVQYYPRSR